MTRLFSTKAQNLKRLNNALVNAHTKPLAIFTVEAWHNDQALILNNIAKEFRCKFVIVRSSVIGEDSECESHAGEYCSVAHVDPSDQNQLCAAIVSVITSYPNADHRNEFFVQEQVHPIKVSGVLSTRDFDTLAPYYVANYDAVSASHDSVTSGSGSGLKTLIRSRFAKTATKNRTMERLLLAAKELEQFFGSDALDIEFALSADDELFILQVRPIATAGKKSPASDAQVEDLLEKIAKKVAKLDAPHPQLCGEKAIFSVMTDWNPAEMIGIKPASIALSLYKELITDSIWAYQRDNYGYRNLRSFPLLISFMGFPYIDVRASFNSFVPKALEEDLANKLIDYYLNMLEAAPTHHDKVEFNIVFSCYDFNLHSRIKKLLNFGFSELEIDRIKFALLNLTNKIISPTRGLYLEDAGKVKLLDKKLSDILSSELSTIDKIYWLTEDCKRFGTLPFAGLARAGFIAVQFLRSFVENGIMTQEESVCFMNSLDTVTKRLARDVNRLKQGTLEKEEFLKHYGHLRPGTYDILSPRYDEAFELYFKASRDVDHEEVTGAFAFSESQLARISEKLKANGLEGSAADLIQFMREAIEGREFGKFMFTKHLSQILMLVETLGSRVGCSREDMAHVNIQTILDMYANLEPPDVKQVLFADIERNKRYRDLTNTLRLPQLIGSAEDIYEFELGDVEPNFVTADRVTEVIVVEEDLHAIDLTDKIVLIKSADPGYDWLFSRKIGGLITMYGGINSHMAIRCAELRIPAVIGCGEENFNKWARSSRLDIDCANRLVRVLR